MCVQPENKGYLAMYRPISAVDAVVLTSSLLTRPEFEAKWTER